MANVLCKHSNCKVFEDPEKGHWGKCLICGAIGEATRTPSEARAVLREVRKERPHNQGGARPGAGRKRSLPKGSKFRAFTLAPKHIRVLDRFVKKYNAAYEEPIRGRSASLRTILEGLDLDQLVASYGE